MSKNLQDKILDETRKRVFQLERQREESKEEKEFQKANIEALVEMSSLSKQEVERIQNQVAAEMALKQAKQAKILKRIGIVVLIIVCIVGYKMMHKTKRINFHEAFDDNRNAWSLKSNTTYNHYFENNEYIFDHHDAEYCYWDAIKLDLPQKYSIEMQSKWISGKYGEYGLLILANSSDYEIFNLRADGAASIAKRKDKEWLQNNEWINNRCIPDGKAINTQTVEVDGDNFKYYVNGNIADDGKFSPIVPTSFGFRVCDEQKIALKHVKVTDLTGKTPKIIFEEDFKKPSAAWSPAERFEKKQSIANGKLIIETNKDDYCFWPSFYKDVESPDYTVSVKSQFIKGETSHYGLLIGENDDDYIVFELTSDGKTRYVHSKNDAYPFIGDYLQTKYKSDGKTINEQKIEIHDNDFKYYINNELIFKGDMKYVKPKMFGVRVCGKQTVWFDDFKINN